MAENRTPRELETREKTVRRWAPASALPTPQPEPGYGFRWVMTHLTGESQPTNVSMRFREGYEPVKAADHPELAYEASARGNVEVGGLMLCKMPTEMIEQRTEHYAAQANNQANAVSSKFLSNSDPRAPLFVENKSKSTRGSFGDGQP